MKTANQLYKESKSSLPFREWIEREKDKGIFIKNQVLADISGSLDNEPVEDNPLTAKFDLGIPKWVIVSGLLIVISAVAYNQYKK